MAFAQFSGMRALARDALNGLVGLGGYEEKGSILIRRFEVGHERQHQISTQIPA
jgi:hypothetical protein